jgi:uncharacterized protein YjiS (DUF1127 family)
MRTTSTALDAHDTVAEESAGGGLLERAFRRTVAAREARTRALVAGHLARLDDASLVDLGFEPNEIRRIRGQASYASLFWF